MTTLVLLPGLDGTGNLFAPLLAELPPLIRPQVVAYPRQALLGYSELAARAGEALPKKDNFVVLGESFSGPVAIEIAAQGHPRLRGLILACSFASTPIPALVPLRHLIRFMPLSRFPPAVLSSVLMGRHATPALRRALAAALLAVEPAVLRERVLATLSVNAVARLASIRCPILYLQALQDRVIPASCASQVQRTCPQTQVVGLGGPHFLLQTQPAASAASIEVFVRSLKDVP